MLSPALYNMSRVNKDPRVKNHLRRLSAMLAFFILGSLFLFSCGRPQEYAPTGGLPQGSPRQIDALNDRSYYFHYRDLDSARLYAERALSLSAEYASGRAEALNNLAFVCIARMDYPQAYALLDSVTLCTDNQVELFIADIQLMRLCQRESRNKEFYTYRERAERALDRIEEERGVLSSRMSRRMVYARSEYAIVTSTYYYYVGLKQPFVETLAGIDPSGEIMSDTAQYANYLYNIGSGGYINEQTADETEQREWETLMLCYVISRRSGLVYWEANALQALSEHLLDDDSRARLFAANAASISYLNEYNMSDSLLAGNLAQRSLEIFRNYGDVYQTAGAYRTLGDCHRMLGDNHSALVCFEDALFSDSAINQAPDLVASIRERMSLNYAAMNDKTNSDINRNIYLDMQERTRQDRQLEARAEQLDHNAIQLNIMITAVIVMIVITVLLMFIFDYLRRKRDNSGELTQLLIPLQVWREDNRRKMDVITTRHEEISEARALSNIHIADNKRRNIENRAKIFLVNSAMPLIDRLLNEVSRLMTRTEPKSVRRERYAYITELTDQINDCNNVLTEWIKLRQGQLSLRIESFRLQEVLDIVKNSRMSFQLKGIELNIDNSETVVKADKILTVFMLNTMADNARKFTTDGGSVSVSASETDEYVEVSVADTGVGMSQEQLDGLFTMSTDIATTIGDTSSDRQKGHGFGLMNCKGIIEKYRKTSRLFGVCAIGAESKPGEGSRFFFRLPKGVLRMLAFLSMLPIASQSAFAAEESLMDRAGAYADSLYNSNIEGRYEASIQWGDSARKCLNEYYRSLNVDGETLMSSAETGDEPAELIWLREGQPVDFDIILAVRNETAVAALALHDWTTYAYNNAIYTQLYKELSADASLGEYVTVMQRAETDKTVAVILLLLLFVIIIIAYYALYYRHRIYYRFCVEQVKGINNMLEQDISDREKLRLLDTQYDVDRFSDSLKNVAEQIRTELEHSIQVSDEHNLNLELAEDELRRADYENEKLHVCNNVIDNCLSTLKHETMYYPSRIRQLLDGTEENIFAIDELAGYYRQLYSLLSMQAASQTKSVNFECRSLRLSEVSRSCRFSDEGITVRGDAVMMSYLFELLQKQSGDKTIEATVRREEDSYVVISIDMPALAYRDFFAPTVENIPFLICRQIVREHGKASSLHGGGIETERIEEGGTRIVITLIATFN